MASLLYTRRIVSRYTDESTTAGEREPQTEVGDRPGRSPITAGTLPQSKTTRQLHSFVFLSPSLLLSLTLELLYFRLIPSR